jgi:hypothetical protein
MILEESDQLGLILEVISSAMIDGSRAFSVKTMYQVSSTAINIS